MPPTSALTRFVQTAHGFLVESRFETTLDSETIRLRTQNYWSGRVRVSQDEPGALAGWRAKAYNSPLHSPRQRFETTVVVTWGQSGGIRCLLHSRMDFVDITVTEWDLLLWALEVALFEEYLKRPGYDDRLSALEDQMRNPQHHDSSTEYIALVHDIPEGSWSLLGYDGCYRRGVPLAANAYEEPTISHRLSWTHIDGRLSISFPDTRWSGFWWKHQLELSIEVIQITSSFWKWQRRRIIQRVPDLRVELGEPSTAGRLFAPGPFPHLVSSTVDVVLGTGLDRPDRERLYGLLDRFLRGTMPVN